MATFDSNFFAANRPITSPHSAGELHIAEGTISFPATLADGDIGRACYLPANCMPVDLIVHTDELDEHATDTLTFDVGLLNDDGDGLVAGSKFLSGSVADAGSTLRATNLSGAFTSIERDETEDRVIAVEITEDPATGKAGDMRVCLIYRAAEWGE